MLEFIQSIVEFGELKRRYFGQLVARWGPATLLQKSVISINGNFNFQTASTHLSH